MKKIKATVVVATIALSNSSLSTQVVPEGFVVDTMRAIKDSQRQFSFPHVPTPELPTDLEGVRVLLVEDTPIQATIATARLRHLGATVEVVTNAEQAIEVAQEFDIVFMDDNLPDSPRDNTPRDGVGRDALLQIAELENPPPVIMHSSSEMPQEFPQFQKGVAKNPEIVRKTQKMLKGLSRKSDEG